MKRDFSRYLLVISSIFSLAAKAVYNPRWERPILEAKLIEVSSDGQEVSKDGIEMGGILDKRLVMNRRDGSKRPTSFVYTEMWSAHCQCGPQNLPCDCPTVPPWNKALFFRVLYTSQDPCGSTRYLALEKKNNSDILVSKYPTNIVSVRPLKRLLVVDHETRICDDFKKYRWEVRLYEGNGSLRYFVGNPEPIITIMSFP